MKDRTKKIITGLGILLIFIGIMLFNFFDKNLINVILIGGLIFVGFILLLYIYLQTGFDFLIPKPDNRIEVEGNNNSIYQIQGNLDSISPEIFKLIKDNHPDAKYFEIIDYTYQFRNRLKGHIQNISRNSNLNLLIGLIITSIAVSLLLYLVFNPASELNSYFALLSHYIPRILIIVFVEIFAFFFLRLYKANIAEIRYFHNELTNIDAKIIGLKSAIWIEDKEVLKSVINSIVETERNFILKKDESTIELEQIKFENEGNKNLSENLTKIIEGITSNKFANSDKK